MNGARLLGLLSTIDQGIGIEQGDAMDQATSKEIDDLVENGYVNKIEDGGISEPYCINDDIDYHFKSLRKGHLISPITAQGKDKLRALREKRRITGLGSMDTEAQPE